MKRAFFARSYFSEGLFWANFPEPETVWRAAFLL
jgi:hypothetical protein